MRITETHRKMLGKMMHWAFVEIRMLVALGKAEQAGDLADAFHNLPKDIWKEEFALEKFRDLYLVPYQEQYPEDRIYDYVKQVNKLLKAGENPADN